MVQTFPTYPPSLDLVPAISGGLSPYQGPWTKKEAAHLLRRTVFGPTAAMIQKATNLGLSSCLDELFNVKLAERPLNHFATNDPEVPVGKTWVNADQSPAQGLNGYRIQSINAWYLLKMHHEEFNLIEKMILFWHNHFVVSDIESPALFYDYFNTLERNALGNFISLTKEMSVCAGMLRYLNGNVNTKSTLNENYARELLELFTIGKGALAGPGDYTTFTEVDVRALTKVFTGWSYTTPYKIEVKYDNSKHDTTNKTLSARFQNALINNAGDKEYANAIDVIFKQDECSRFISRKLYRWFLHYEITDLVEQDIIEPMAAIIRADNYNIAGALRSLLASEHFFSEASFGCMIKSPIDFILSISNSLKFPVPTGLHDKYIYFANLWTNMKLMDQTVSEITDVAGWKAYYQEPLFYRHWINGVTLQERKKFITQFVLTGITVNQLNNLRIPVLEIINSFANPADINSLIQELSELIFSYPLTATQIETARQIILNGGGDYVWRDEYNKYKADPSNSVVRDGITAKLRLLFLHLMNLPEFLLH